MDPVAPGGGAAEDGDSQVPVLAWTIQVPDLSPRDESATGDFYSSVDVFNAACLSSAGRDSAFFLHILVAQSAGRFVFSSMAEGITLEVTELVAGSERGASKSEVRLPFSSFFSPFPGSPQRAQLDRGRAPGEC